MAKDSEVLRAARKRVNSGRNRWICSAIFHCDRGTREQRAYLTDWVSGMLDIYFFYDSWLCKFHYKEWREMSDHNDHFRAGRLAWLDWMIAECEKREARHGQACGKAG